MMGNKFFFAITMCVGATMFVACSDDDSDDQNKTGGQEYKKTTSTLYSHDKCDSLIYIEGVEPTTVKDGVFPHWHCDECNRNYLDKEGKILYKGLPHRPGICHRIPQELLDRCNVTMPWSDLDSKSGTTRGVSVSAVVKGVLKIVSSISSSKEKHEFKSTLSDISSTVKSIQFELEQIQGDIEELKDKVDKILQLLQTLDEQTAVNDAYKQLEWLYDLSNDYFRVIDTKINRFTNNGAISVDDLSDADKDSLSAEIANVVKYWGENEVNEKGANPIAITTNLLNTFYTTGMEGVQRVPFTDVLKKYVRTYRYWDDSGYYDRMQFLRFYQLSTDMAAYLASLYTQNVADMDNDLRQQKMDDLYLGVDTLNIGISADSTRMANAYQHYRVFRNASRTVYLELNPVKGSLEDWFKKYLNDTSFNFADNSQLAPHIDDFLKSFAGDDFITDDEIDAIYEAGASYGQDTLTNIFKEHDLDMNPLKLEYPILFPQRFGHRNNNKSKTDALGWEETETAEISGFWVELKKRKHDYYWETHTGDKEHDGKWSILYGNIWMNYSHADDNIRHKNSEYDTHWFTNNDLWTIWDMSWSSWIKSCDWRYCIPRQLRQSTPKSAKYVVTFKHYKGEKYD